MKKTFKISKLLFLLTVVLAVSCEDVLVNEDPNGVIITELKPEVILPGAQVLNASYLMDEMNTVGNTMVATWSGNAQQIQSPYNTEFNYQVDANFYGAIWSNLFVRTANFTQIMNYSGGGDYSYYKAAAQTMRVFYFQYLTDLYGDMPYSEIHQRGELLFPKYDAQEDVYLGLISEIDNAIQTIENANTATAIPMSTDVMFSGDMSQWLKLANTVKLKLLVRLRYLDQSGTNTNISTAVTQGFNDLNTSGAQFIGLGEDVTINPGYSDEAERMNPFAERFGYDAGNFGTVANATTSNTATGPTEFLVELLDGTTVATSDNRLPRLYTVRAGQPQIIGNVQGGNTAQPSRLGLGLLNSPTQDGYIFTAAESLFLQAEAIQEGYLTSGNARGTFEDGIRASFTMLGAGGADAYILASANNAQIGWDGATTPIEAIITQKFIALGGTNGAETWIEYNRTGFPSNMPIPVSTSRTTRPSRLLYPSAEYSGNTANVSGYNQTQETPFNTTVFWDVN